ERFRRFEQRERDLASAHQMLQAANVEPDIAEMAEEEVRAAGAEIEALRFELQAALLPRDPDDERSAFLEIRAGTGGDESALFAGDLARMYLRHSEQRRWQTEVMSESTSDLGGYKEVVFRISGDGVYGRLKFESGGHRVQRVPVTETQGRIHTSACTVAVLPEPDPAEEVKLNPAELRIDTFRASGAGGQHVNKTDSAVRLTHLPTGLVVQCQNERSQHKNKSQAMRVLRSRLYDMRKAEADARAAASVERKKIEWGSQIRSYVLAPYQQVTDHRTELKIGKVDAVLDGDLDELIRTFLLQEGSQARQN
ncbi:MAG TPA: peptide chain release factor 1, partial [Kofleriaceae bacterium]|nr:peptide chain release factor 1 [Kofleriaceae bacterium]